MATAPQINEKTVSETRNVAVSFSGKLDSGELLTGTPTVVDAASPSPGVLTFSNIAVSTAILTINGVSVPVGEAVQFSVVGGVANITYDMQITAATDSTPAQSLIGIAKLIITADDS